MSDLVVKFIAGQFTPPNSDNPYRLTPTSIEDNRTLGIQSKVLTAFITQKAKQLGSAGASRIGNATGNRSAQRNAQAAIEIGGDVASVVTGLYVGGPIGGAIAIGAVAIQRSIEAYDISLNLKRATIESDEQKRRAGFINVDKRSEHR